MDFTKDSSSGYFGKWIIDEYGLPAYEYTCIHHSDPIAKTRTSGKKSTDHFHQLGNDRLTLTAHNSGVVQIFSGDRGFEWVSYVNTKRNCLGGAIAFIKEGNKIWTDIFTKNFESSENYRRIFGIGYYKKVLIKQKLKIDHIICPMFGSRPFIISRIKITNLDNIDRKFSLGYYYSTRIKCLIGNLMSNLYVTKERKDFGNKIISLIGRILKTLIISIGQGGEQVRERFASKFRYKAKYDKEKNILQLIPRYKHNLKISREMPSDRNFFPGKLFLMAVDNKYDKNKNRENLENSNAVNYEYNYKYYNSLKIKKRKNKFIIFRHFKENCKDNPCLFLEKQINLNPGESKEFKFIFGYLTRGGNYKIEDEVNNVIHSLDIDQQISFWKDCLIAFKIRDLKLKWIEKETKWHAYYLKSALLFDEYFNANYITQGNAYTFLHGANGAIRDFILFNYSMIFIEPKMARNFLIYIMRTMRPNGELPYAIKGFGQLEGAIVHESSSDLGIFLLWGLLDYIYFTRDFEFLEEKINFYPKNSGKSSTVYERLKLIIKHLIQNIGFGEHGLIRVGSGDWSDGISLFVKNRKKFLKYGESNFNSAFFLYLIPKLIPMLENKDKDLKNKLLKIYDSLKEACLKTWNGKWFYRGYDGTGTPIGDKNIFLEHHPWLLLSGILSAEQREVLINNIYQILDKNSKIGQYVCFPPNKTIFNILPGGIAENGGIWFAMNFLLTWAYSIYDRNKAINSLIKNSMANKAKQFPKIWYGIWSGPDSYNADYTKYPGETFNHPITPQLDFPIMNMNIHANFLNSLLKLIGIEAYYDYIIIDPKFNTYFSIKTKLITLEYQEDKISIDINFLKGDTLNLIIKLPEDFGKEISIIINENEVKNFKIKENQVIIEGFKETLAKLKIKILKNK
ncbi:MAG: GH36-type glycosyl hydrolase domain-containing protein [Candidatus Helarchaeota archaeon]